MPDQNWLTPIQEVAEGWSAEEVVDWSLSRFRRKIAIASAFGPEGIVLIDIALRIRKDVQIFTLDTGLFFPETYRLIDEVERRYQIRIERVKPDLTIEEQAARHGDALWTRSPDHCCSMRKIEPLRRKLATLDAWATAIRRDQTPERSQAKKVEWDNKFGLIKVNPLCDWTNEMVWDYVREHGLPYNPLHDCGYPSIGCQPCTSTVRSGENPRSGRWSGLAKTECGLHQRPSSNELRVLGD